MPKTNHSKGAPSGQRNERYDRARQNCPSIKEIFGVARDGPVRCQLSSHPGEDKKPSASITTNSRGEERLMCFVCLESSIGVLDVNADHDGCSVEDIVDRYAPRDQAPPKRRSKKVEKPRKKGGLQPLQIPIPELDISMGEPDLKKHEWLMKVWEVSKLAHKSNREAFAVVEKRLGKHTERAFELGLIIICAKSQEKWFTGYPILSPLYQCLVPVSKVGKIKTFPCDYEKRPLDTNRTPKLLKVRDACENTARSFGRLDLAIERSVDGDLWIVEGDYNFISYALALEEKEGVGLVGVPGAGFSRRIAAALFSNLDWNKKNGHKLPGRIITDFDHDDAGKKGAEFVRLVADYFGIPILRTVREPGEKGGRDANDILQENWSLEEVANQALEPLPEYLAEGPEKSKKDKEDPEQKAERKLRRELEAKAWADYRRLEKIVISKDIGAMADSLEAILIMIGFPIFQQSGRLVLVRNNLILELTKALLMEIASRHAYWRGMPSDDSSSSSKKRKKSMKAPPPRLMPSGHAIEASLNRGSWGFPELKGIVTEPTLRPDGSIITEPGYDKKTGLFYQPSESFPEIPDNPSANEVALCKEMIERLFAQFPFQSNSDVSALFSVLFTGCTVHAHEGPIPMHIITARTPGTGKSLLASTSSRLCFGQCPRIMNYNNREEEQKKEILAILDEGHRSVNIDNIDTPFGSPVFSAVLTTREYSARRLGKNTIATVPVNVLFLGTGNNVAIKGDVGRRILVIRLDAECERPEEREDFDIENLTAYVQEHRPQLLCAILTLLRAFFVAGAPKPTWRHMGSFEEWSNLVRGILEWLGFEDPMQAKEEYRRDHEPEQDAIREVFDLWAATWPFSEVSALQIEERANKDPELSSALMAAGVRGEKVTAKSIGHFLGRIQGRPFGGRKVQRCKGRKWQIINVGGDVDQLVTNGLRSLGRIDEALQTSEWVDRLARVGVKINPRSLGRVFNRLNATKSEEVSVVKMPRSRNGQYWTVILANGVVSFESSVVKNLETAPVEASNNNASIDGVVSVVSESEIVGVNDGSGA